jgi:hypothetical protein
MTDAVPPDEPAGPSPHLHARAVPWRHVFAWFEEGMRLFKRAPATWAGLAFCTLAVELGVSAVPEFGPLLAQFVAPLVAAGMVYAAAADDRGGRASIRQAIAVFTAPAGAIAAIIAANLVTFSGEALAAWWIADVNLLAPGDDADLSKAAIVGMVAMSVLMSLPVAFVPFHVLLERVPAGAAFRSSWNAFVLNTSPLLAYAAAALVLVGFGAATMGLGLLLALPLLATTGYAAWKDVFGVGDTPS